LIHALEAVLASNGVSTLDDGPTFVQIVPIPLRSQLDAQAGGFGGEMAKAVIAHGTPACGHLAY